MKKSYRQLLVTGLALFIGASPSFGAEVGPSSSNRLDANGLPKVIKAPIGKRISAEELNAKRKTIEKRRQFVRLESRPNSDPFSKSIYDSSAFLTVNGTYTILPPGAVAYTPAHHASKVVDSPSGKFVLWPEFLKTNGKWLRTIEVSIEQAKGREPVDPSRCKALRSAGVVVVALYEDHPVSFRGKFEIPTDADKK